MREFYGVMLRYVIVAALAITAMSLVSCGTSAQYSTGYHGKVHHKQFNSCAAYN